MGFEPGTFPPIPDELRATASFYDEAAARYDSEVDVANNLELRAAFRRRVVDAATPGSTILDFGCGTGSDAAWYASRGYRTVAYDISPGMIDCVRRKCEREIAAGAIIPLTGAIDRLDAQLARVGALGAIAANFAVLNHVRDLRPLFRLFARHVVPGGIVVASVLNPFYWRDMTRGWWWTSACRSLGTGAIRFAGDVVTYRHRVGSLRRMAAPAFALPGPGRQPLDPQGDGVRVLSWLNAWSTNFLVLTFRRCDETAPPTAPQRTESPAPADRLSR
jgi:SAM-dependent methyltransferase